MPKILGLNLVPVLVASVVFFFVGFLWYGVLFAEQWTAAMGITEADVEGDSPLYMLGGFIITVMQVIGIGLVLKWRNISALQPAVMTALLLWLFFALPFCHYSYLYTPQHAWSLLVIDASHLLVGWLASAAVLSLMKA